MWILSGPGRIFEESRLIFKLSLVCLLDKLLKSKLMEIIVIVTEPASNDKCSSINSKKKELSVIIG